MEYYLKCKEIYAEDKVIEDSYILIKNGYIEKIGKEKNRDVEVIDLGEFKAIPGLIDLHIHGANGQDVMDATYDSLNKISLYLAKNGVTSFLATTLTAPLEKIKNAIENVRESMTKGLEGAEVLGTYLEGPYLTEEHKGAHPVRYMRELKLDEIRTLLDISGDTIKIVTIAPEKENSTKIIEYLKKRDVKTSIGHTNATYKEAIEAIKMGAKIGVHTFNGMTGLHHREPGVVGAIMDSEDIYAELIADNIHVDSAVMRILYRLKGNDKLYLISDCMRAGGLDDGEYILGELKVEVKNRIARTESGSLAGSTLKIKDGIKNIMDATNINLFRAIRLASIVPAKALGLADEIGSLKEKKKANITIIDDELNICGTIVNGKVVYEKGR
ncbi:N-acetylglucosamine-6-phosphate deacetylase [Clostridium sp. D2Q-11]|uniref:N-acetylglucosamine-6-phosphate deacetylase n=1 Tax=Anaeromonas frigoriresistens TaxID=2683708 RepID=A0A942V147_9FIRM|nr:N-acetylglucosamine-6-phosphate deacetylase [Anaeromonas frigoriresistens]MBS4538112.1 N-acetylglucosamine-6-phosphate deacetylase [Anaeromonas frigoriresistens]